MTQKQYNKRNSNDGLNDDLNETWYPQIALMSKNFNIKKTFQVPAADRSLLQEINTTVPSHKESFKEQNKRAVFSRQSDNTVY